jgi:GntR family transcriptional regulator/MocR family aminotransferase
LFVVQAQPVAQPFPSDQPFASGARGASASVSASTPSNRVIDFSLLTIDGASFPMRLWRSVSNEALALGSAAIHEYGDVQGEYGLRVSLANYLRSSRGVVCSPEQIVVGTGISSSIHLLSRLLERHDHIGIERHSIAQVREAFKQHGFQIVPVSLPAATADGAAGTVAQAITAGHKQPAAVQPSLLYVTPSHRPAGEILPYAARQHLLQWAYERNGYIIEDDYDGELRLSGKPVPALQSLDQKGVVIYIGTFSKVFTPALRMNYMVLPVHLTKKLQLMHKLLSCPSRMEQWAMELFISRGYWYRHLRRMRRLYRAKHDKLVALLHRYMPDAVQVRSSGSGLHIELSVRTVATAETLIQLAQQQGVLVYGSQDEEEDMPCGNPKIYLGFGGVREEEIELGVQLLRLAWPPLP